jgi:PKD repeat protein
MTSRVATVGITVTPVNDAPTVELAPAGTVDEVAAPVTLTAHATDVDGDPVTYGWKTTDGTLTSSGATATFAADDGPAVAHVTVAVDDGKGGTGSATIDIEVRNVPPSADAGANAEGIWGLPVSFTGSASDVSGVDTAAGLGASWSFGDGSAAAAGVAVSHVYSDPGSYTATLTATDKDGGAGTDTASATIRWRAAALAYAGPSGLNASSAAVSVQLEDSTDAGSARLGGHAVTIALGTNTCTATTEATGLARCVIDASALPLGPATVTAAFGGDELYTAASASAPVVLYALPAGGVFVVGDKTAAGAVTFWSPQWWLRKQPRQWSCAGELQGLRCRCCARLWRRLGGVVRLRPPVGECSGVDGRRRGRHRQEGRFDDQRRHGDDRRGRHGKLRPGDRRGAAPSSRRPVERGSEHALLSARDLTVARFTFSLRLRPRFLYDSGHIFSRYPGHLFQ